MKYRQLGQSDIQASAVTLGAWAIGGWMWGGQKEKEAIAAIHKSLECGVNAIDTAPVYGFGRSEELVGKAIRDHKREDIYIFTKYGLRWDRTDGEYYFPSEDLEGNKLEIYRVAKPDSVIEECENSLRRLGVDYIDLYQCHWPDSTTEIEATMEAIQKLLDQGKIRASGVSNYSVEQMEKANNAVPLTASQPPYSMVNRDVEDGVIPWCIEHNVGVIPYSPMQRGLLTGKITPDYEFGEGDHRADSPFFEDENVRKVNAMLDKIKPIAEGHDATLAQLAVNWCIHQPGITSALVGARNEKQAEENAAAADFDLSEDEMKQINSLLDGLDLDV
ncbi:MAG: aldo/keto reductase [Phycisphaerae bacterium]